MQTKMKFLPSLYITRLPILLAFSFLLHTPQGYAQKSTPKLDTISRVVHDYSEGFVKSDSDLIRNVIGQQLMMVNGNFSGEPVDWQAHQFLSGNEIDQWIEMMLKQAGPFENQVVVKNIDLRGNSGLVVTKETGKNKFRSWENEEVAYMLGKVPQGWKIVGFFIKDLRNPE